MKNLIMVGLLVGTFGVAQANITFLSADIGQSVSIKYNSVVKGVFAGKLKFRDTATNKTFLSVCCDLQHFISSGQSYNVNTLGTAAQSGGLKLAGNIVAAMFTGATTNLQAAALQLAVWEATYDGVSNGTQPNFGNGVFEATISGSLLNQAKTYYSAISTPGNALYLKPSPTNGGQAQMTAVPEPATMLVIAGALLARRARRKA